MCYPGCRNWKKVSLQKIACEDWGGNFRWPWPYPDHPDNPDQWLPWPPWPWPKGLFKIVLDSCDVFGFQLILAFYMNTDISWEHRVVDKQARVLNFFFFFFSKDWAKIVDKARLWEGWQGKALKCGEGATIKAVVRCGFNSRFSLYVQGVPETSDFIRWSKFNVKWLNLYNQKLIC